MKGNLNNLMRKGISVILLAAMLCSACACAPITLTVPGAKPRDTVASETAAADTAQTGEETVAAKISYKITTKEEGIICRLSNDQYFDRLNQYDLNYRMQRQYDMSAGLDEFKQYCADQVLDFTDDERKLIDGSMQRIGQKILDEGFELPMPEMLYFIKTTMADEGGAGGYTHQTQIYLGAEILEMCAANMEDPRYYRYFDEIVWHEMFHALTRNFKDFKKNIYSVVGAEVLDEEIPMPDEIKNNILSNPDVDVFDSVVPLTINGEKKLCAVIPCYTKDFEKEGDTFFDAVESKLFPINSDGELYSVDDASDFWEVFGKNTGYIIAIEETLADNFALAMNHTEEELAELPTPEILYAIRNAVKRDVIEEVEEEESESDEASSDHRNGSPWLNSDLVGTVTEDTVTNPKDDLYLYANKEWMLATEIPDGYSSWSHYNEVSNATDKKGVELLDGEKLEGHDGELIQTFYNLYCDMDERNKIGVAPFKEDAETIMSVETLDDLTALMIDEKYKNILDEAISLEVSRGISDSEYYYGFLSSGSLIMDDPADYVDGETEYGTMLKDRGREIFEYMMGRIGMDKAEADKRYDDCIAFETKLAEKMYTNEQQMSSEYFQMINNEMTYDEVKGLVKNYPLMEILEAHDFTYDKPYVVMNPDYFKHLDSLYTEENVELFKNYMLVSDAISSITYMDEDAFNTYVEITNKYFGTSGMRPLKERAYTMVANYLSGPLAREYIKKYSSEEDKKRVAKVCYDVIDTYREMLTNNDWLSQETKDYAIRKLDSMTVNVGWPDKWEDCTKLDLSGLTYKEACNAIADYEARLSISKLGQKPDAEMWASELGNILMCNAFYDPQTNAINMIVGMMERPFYYSDMPIEELYASLGAFWIGHEVSHAFDSNGAQFDIDGNLSNWWTEEDLAEFEKRVDKMDKYLDTMLIMDDYYVNGSNVDSEMIADMTGLQCALEMAKKVDNFDYKKFFEYFCQMNGRRSLYTTQLALIQGDVHPLDYMRGNVPAQQFEEFYETYDVKEGDGMYLAPEDRLLIW